MNSDMFSDKFYWHDCFGFFLYNVIPYVYLQNQNMQVLKYKYTHTVQNV